LIRSISVVIPAYNEEKRLPQTLERVAAYLNAHDLDFREIVVVDDGSSDATAAFAERFAAGNKGVRVLKNGANRGKGYSVRSGMMAAAGEWVLFSDADLSAPIEQLEVLMQAVESEGADVVIGSRALDRSLVGVHQPGFRESAGKFFNFVMRLAVGLPIHDTQCGFKLFSLRAVRTIFPRQRLDRFGFDVEVLLIAHLHGFCIEEVPVQWSHIEGTRVSMLGGMRAFVELLEIRVNQILGRYH
jgi:glycosyltransferase involved in cell wall biosynthesis